MGRPTAPRFVVALLLIGWVLAMCCEAHCGALENVERYIRHDRRGMKTTRTNEIVARLAPLIVECAAAEGIDPLLVAVLVATESSWDPGAIGKRGEIGLIQAMPRLFRKAGIRLADITVRDQLEVGIKELAHCIRSCRGNILGGLTLYHMGSTGGCSRSSSRARYKFRLYQKARK